MFFYNFFPWTSKDIPQCPLNQICRKIGFYCLCNKTIINKINNIVLTFGLNIYHKKKGAAISFRSTISLMKNLQAQKNNANERRSSNLSRRFGALSSRSIVIITLWRKKSKANKRAKISYLPICHYNEEAHSNLSYEEIIADIRKKLRVKPSRSVSYASLNMYIKLSAFLLDQFREVSEKKQNL